MTEQNKTLNFLIQSEKMLSIGGLAAGMAHEINNPTAVIMQIAEVMSIRLGGDLNLSANIKAAEEAGTTIESIRKFIEARNITGMIDIIRKSGKRITLIVNNMLSFARKSDTMLSTHDLTVLMDQTLELAVTDYDLKKHFDFRQIEIRKEYEMGLPLLPCMASKIQQVFLNILHNGAQAMHQSGIKNPLFILRLKFDNSCNMIIIEIEDNGPGMDVEVHKHIFEPFFTTKPVGKGTGLGLSVAYFIITENHNGELSAKSSPGKGSNFIISLPAEGEK
jgi:signal transduction histidine kinase